MSRRAVLAGLLATALLVAGCGSSGTSGSSPPPSWKPGDAITLAVGTWFPPATQVRDAYGGSTATVDASGSVRITPGPSGVTLLEKVGAAPSAFDWKDATVYFVMTDRFQNGDTTNDHAYGRQGDGASEIGTWHGGDFAGLTAKLDYIASLGATAIWISPIVEQVHGWVAGGTGDFKHYGYHGYFALDFTRIDQNLGTPAELQALVDAAHARGIRVLLDVVMNHPGYATPDDLVAYLPEVFWDGTGAAYQAWLASPPPPPVNWNDVYHFINYGADGWKNWWANVAFLDASQTPATYTWIRAGSSSSEFPGFQKPGADELTKSLSFLPDFITEGTAVAGVPTLFARKAARAGDGTGVVEILGGTVRDYLVKWHSDWVRQFGFDGFRCDTAANVELASWAALQASASAAFEAWKAANPGKPIDPSAPFWMTGEAYGHGVTKDAYYSSGFDSLINFTFQPWLRDLLWAKASLVAGADDLDALYASYASKISSDPTFNVLSYVSSHDTRLFFGDILGYDSAMQRQAGTALLLLPGAVQIFYGDESGRRLGPAGSDPAQGTRSDMNWSTPDASILQHWQKLGAFRKAHAAVGAGTHTRISSIAGTYAFARAKGAGPSGDAVVVVVTAPY